MGPRSCNRGENAIANASANASELQWGRGHVTAESHGSNPSYDPGMAASMGPRSCNRGETEFGQRLRILFHELQWGRGHVTAESGPLQLWRTAYTELQWGRGHVTAERETRQVPDGKGGTLQWGRGHVTAESTAKTYAPAHAGMASMGPRSCNRGEDRRHGFQVRDVRPASMGPRSCNRGEGEPGDGRGDG